MVFNQVLLKADDEKVRLVKDFLGGKLVTGKGAGESEWVTRASDCCAALREARPGQGEPQSKECTLDRRSPTALAHWLDAAPGPWPLRGGPYWSQRCDSG